MTRSRGSYSWERAGEHIGTCASLSPLNLIWLSFSRSASPGQGQAWASFFFLFSFLKHVHGVGSGLNSLRVTVVSVITKWAKHWLIYEQGGGQRSSSCQPSVSLSNLGGFPAKECIFLLLFAHFLIPPQFTLKNFSQDKPICYYLEKMGAMKGEALRAAIVYKTEERMSTVPFIPLVDDSSKVHFLGLTVWPGLALDPVAFHFCSSFLLGHVFHFSWL